MHQYNEENQSSSSQHIVFRSDRSAGVSRNVYIKTINILPRQQNDAGFTGKVGIRKQFLELWSQRKLRIKAFET